MKALFQETLRGWSRTPYQKELNLLAGKFVLFNTINPQKKRCLDKKSKKMLLKGELDGIDGVCNFIFSTIITTFAC